MAANTSGSPGKAAQAQRSGFKIIEARLSDVESLTTIMPRAFHPTNDYIKRALPDGQAMRSWWTSVFSDMIRTPTSHLLTAVIGSGPNHDPQSTADVPEPSGTSHAIAVLALSLHDASAPGPGFWSSHPLSSDHNLELCEPMFAAVADGRDEYMPGKTHFIIELFGVEHAYQGGGLGGRLIQEVCRLADDAGHEIFVQANGFARKFYEKHGFVCKGTKIMPGGKYEECMMVRAVGGRNAAE